MENNEVSVVVLTPQQNDVLNLLLTTLPKDKQLGWLQLCNSKNKMKATLEQESLVMQSLITTYDTQSIEDLQKNIDAYIKGVKGLTELRKGFTKYLDVIYDDLMSVEKNAAAWETLPLAQAKLLTLKEDAEKKITEANAKINEKNRFIAHVTNQHIAIKRDYELALEKTITDTYLSALDQELTEDGLKNVVIQLENTLTNLQRNPPVRFSTTLPENYVLLNTAEELGAVGNTIQAPNYAEVLQKKIVESRQKFTLYFSDKAAGSNAKDFIQQESKSKLEAVVNNAETSKAVTDLISKGSSGATLNFGNVKPIIRGRTIVIKDTDPNWVRKIISEFLARFDSCAPRLTRLKAWGNLTVKQMAVALQEEEETIIGLDYEETKK